MIKYLLLIVSTVLCFNAQAQKFDKGIVTGPMTTAEIEAIAPIQEGRLIGNSSTGTIWYYNGDEWIDLGEGSTGDQTAAEVPITDSGAYFTGTDVEAALQELGAGTSGGTTFIKKNIRIATTANITLSGLQTIDGNLTAQGERVLVKNQSTPSQNGIYLASSGSWARSPEANTKQKLARTYVYVTSGSTMFDKFFLTDFDVSDTLGTSDVVFTETPFDLTGGTDDLPLGGTTGQSLVKASDDDGDVEWSTIEGTELVGITQEEWDEMSPEEQEAFTGFIISDEAAGSYLSLHPQNASMHRLFIGTESEKDAADIEEGDITFITDAAPAETATGTVLDMGGYFQTDDTSVDTATFTLTNIKNGGYHEVFINKSGSAPTITGATIMPGTLAFAASTDMVLCVKVFNGSVKYWFVAL